MRRQFCLLTETVQAQITGRKRWPIPCDNPP
jgi:hypothetical protein